MTCPSHIARKWQSREKKPDLSNPSPMPYPLDTAASLRSNQDGNPNDICRVQCLKLLGLKTLWTSTHFQALALKQGSERNRFLRIYATLKMPLPTQLPSYSPLPPGSLLCSIYPSTCWRKAWQESNDENRGLCPSWRKGGNGGASPAWSALHYVARLRRALKHKHTLQQRKLHNPGSPFKPKHQKGRVWTPVRSVGTGLIRLLLWCQFQGYPQHPTCIIIAENVTHWNTYQ